MTEAGTPERILDAVQRMIVEHGVHGTSLRLVAEEADVSLGLLSYHFANKESLILAAFSRAVLEVRDAAVEAISQSQDPSERLRLLVRTLFAPQLLSSAYPPLAVACWSMALTDDGVASMIGGFRDGGLRLIDTLVGEARPDLTAAEVHVRAMDVAASIDGMTLHWARFGDVDTLERGLHRCEALALGDK